MGFFQPEHDNRKTATPAEQLQQQQQQQQQLTFS